MTDVSWMGVGATCESCHSWKKAARLMYWFQCRSCNEMAGALTNGQTIRQKEPSCLCSPVFIWHMLKMLHSSSGHESPKLSSEIRHIVMKGACYAEFTIRDWQSNLQHNHISYFVLLSVVFGFTAKPKILHCSIYSIDNAFPFSSFETDWE